MENAKTALKDYLLESISTLEETVQQLNSWNGCLDHLDVYENDEEFFNMMFEGKPMEAVRAAHYGDYSYSDDYVRINGYGNLDSCNDHDYHEELQDSVDEIIDNLLSYHHHLSLDGELEELIEAVEEEEE